MDIEVVKSLIRALEESALKKLVVKEKEFEVSLEKPDLYPPTVALQQPHLLTPHPATPLPAAAPEHPQKDAVKEGHFITSPMVGTFYGRAAPDQPLFVKVGDMVEEQTVIGIIEAMKVMNEIKAHVKGRIAEILVESGHPVEFGTKLFRIHK